MDASAITVTSVGSGPWNTPGTWDNGVPNPGDVVIIAGGDNVTLDVNTGALHSLLMAPLQPQVHIRLMPPP